MAKAAAAPKKKRDRVLHPERVDDVTGETTTDKTGSHESGHLVVKVGRKAVRVDDDDIVMRPMLAAGQVELYERLAAPRRRQVKFTPTSDFDWSRVARSTFSTSESLWSVIDWDDAFDDDKLEDADTGDITRDALSRFQVKVGKRSVPYSKTTRGEALLDLPKGRAMVKAALLAMASTGNKRKRYRDVPWLELSSYATALSDTFGSIGWSMPLEAVHAGMLDEWEIDARLDDKTREDWHAWRLSQRLFTAARTLREVASGKRGAVPCKSAASRRVLVRRAGTLEKWASDPADSPVWADEDLMGGIKDELTRAMTSCDAQGFDHEQLADELDKDQRATEEAMVLPWEHEVDEAEVDDEPEAEVDEAGEVFELAPLTHREPSRAEKQQQAARQRSALALAQERERVQTQLPGVSDDDEPTLDFYARDVAPADVPLLLDAEDDDELDEDEDDEDELDDELLLDDEDELDDELLLDDDDELDEDELDELFDVDDDELDEDDRDERYMLRMDRRARRGVL
jgi:hypothetical protein